jgi:hypothetical protein
MILGLKEYQGREQDGIMFGAILVAEELLGCHEHRKLDFALHFEDSVDGTMIAGHVVGLRPLSTPSCWHSWL